MTGRGLAAGVVVNDQALVPPMPEVAPKGTDGDKRQMEVDGDLGEGLAVEMAPDDLLAGDEGDGTWHGSTSRVDQWRRSKDFIDANASGV